MINNLFDLIKFAIIKIKYSIGWLSINEFNDCVIDFIKSQGIVFIKFSQIVSSRSDTENICGKDLFNKLTNLQDKCYQNEINLREDLNYINNTPVASGSICQIFKIKYNNKISICKTLVPNIDLKINESFKKLSFYKQILGIVNNDYYKLSNLINENEFKSVIMSHLNLEKEVENTNKFRQIFCNTDKIIIPEIYKYDGSIIMSYNEGIKLTDIKSKKHFDQAMFLIMSFFYTSIKNNLLHGDFHQSNFYFLIDNDEVKMIVLDFGIVFEIEDKHCDLILKIFNTALSDQERNILYLEILDEVNIKLKNDRNINNQQISFYNLFENVELSEVSIKYLTICMILPYYGNIIRQYKLNTFFIKLFNFMYKNKIL